MYLISIFLKLILLLITFFALTYFLKKFKKYKLIFKVNGLDGIYYYFKNKNYKNNGIWNFIDKKKYELGKKLAKYSKEKILFGPYSGTRLIFKSGWSNTDFGSKYLGTYEKQIQKKIIYLKKKFLIMISLKKLKITLKIKYLSYLNLQKKVQIQILKNS